MATEILRPTADGDTIELTIGGSSPAATNWESVDEAVADDGVTTVYVNSAGATRYDLYGLGDMTLADKENYKVTNVKIYVRVYGYTAATHTVAVGLKTNSEEDWASPHTITPAATWMGFDDSWPTNPITEADWAWDEIDALQVGVKLYDSGSGFPTCTQIYVEIEYEVASGADKWVEIPDVTRVLALDNEIEFTPDADYEPATKKYVDDNAGNIQIVETLPSAAESEINGVVIKDGHFYIYG